MYILINNNTL